MCTIWSFIFIEALLSRYFLFFLKKMKILLWSKVLKADLCWQHFFLWLTLTWMKSDCIVKQMSKRRRIISFEHYRITMMKSYLNGPAGESVWLFYVWHCDAMYKRSNFWCRCWCFCYWYCCCCSHKFIVIQIK